MNGNGAFPRMRLSAAAQKKFYAGGVATQDAPSKFPGTPELRTPVGFSDWRIGPARPLRKFRNLVRNPRNRIKFPKVNADYFESEGFSCVSPHPFHAPVGIRT